MLGVYLSLLTSIPWQTSFQKTNRPSINECNQDFSPTTQNGKPRLGRQGRVFPFSSMYQQLRPFLLSQTFVKLLSWSEWALGDPPKKPSYKAANHATEIDGQKERKNLQCRRVLPASEQGKYGQSRVAAGKCPQQKHEHFPHGNSPLADKHDY